MAKIKLRLQYRFDTLRVGGFRKVNIADDPKAGSRALSAAYNYARRYNATAKRARDHIMFAGRRSKDGRFLRIHRVA